MKVDYANLARQTARYRTEIDLEISKLIDSTSFILGPAVAKFEDELSEFVGCKHSISCGSGTDALLLAMMALDIGPGDEVITTPFSFIATAETIALLQATPVFVDIESDTFNIDVTQLEQAITPKTKAIMPVGLYGQVADMDEINAIAEKYGIAVIEDAAQSFGAMYKGKRSGNLSTIGCTSFFPAKPLGAFGDGGAAFTNDAKLAEKMRSLRVHGQQARYQHQYIGFGARMDALQAVIVGVKLKYYQQDIDKRNEMARAYNEHLQVNTDITLPTVKDDRESVWAQYTLKVGRRDALQKALTEKGIPTAVHYPVPLHLQPCFEYLGLSEGTCPVAEAVSKQVLSIPLSPDHSVDEINFITAAILDAI